MKKVFQALLTFLPWPIRRIALQKCFGFQIDRTAIVGFSLLDVKCIHLGAGVRIGHLNYFRGLDRLTMDEESRIGNLNWFTAIQGGQNFSNGRKRELNLKRHSAITSRHYFDCNDAITVGEFTTIAGVRSTFLTHGIDLGRNVQTTSPIAIGQYCFIGSNVLFLSDSIIGDFSLVAAGTVIPGKRYPDRSLIAGVPGRVIKEGLSGEYFQRKFGFVE